MSAKPEVPIILGALGSGGSRILSEHSQATQANMLPASGQK